jgi:hypothetical protein
MSSGTKQTQKADKRAAALRENLRKRKALEKAKKTGNKNKQG